jgi:hypothetical protein
MANYRIYDQPQSYLNLPFYFAEANIPKGTLVKLTGDKTVGAATGSGDLVIGEVEVTVTNTEQLGTVRTFFRRVFQVTLAETVVAGEVGALSAKSGTGKDTAQTFGKAGAQSLLFNRCLFLEGGDKDDIVEVGVF